MLAIQQKEMELLIRRASLSLYLKDQLDSYNTRLLELYEENKELRTVVEKITDLKVQVTELDIEIESNDMAEKVYEIIRAIKRPRSIDIETGGTPAGIIWHFFKSLVSQLIK